MKNGRSVKFFFVSSAGSSYKNFGLQASVKKEMKNCELSCENYYPTEVNTCCVTGLPYLDFYHATCHRILLITL